MIKAFYIFSIVVVAFIFLLIGLTLCYASSCKKHYEKDIIYSDTSGPLPTVTEEKPKEEPPKTTANEFTPLFFGNDLTNITPIVYEESTAYDMSDIKRTNDSYNTVNNNIDTISHKNAYVRAARLDINDDLFPKNTSSYLRQTSHLLADHSTASIIGTGINSNITSLATGLVPEIRPSDGVVEHGVYNM